MAAFVRCLARLLVIALACFVLLACSKSEPGSEKTDKRARGDQRKRELVAEHGARSPPERIQAAMSICYVGEECDGLEAEALLDAAASDTERDALRATARSALARQYRAALEAQGKKPENVKTSGDSNNVLSVTGDVCTRFLLENFASGTAGKTAKLVGFRRFECESKSLSAGVDL
jgi:hypothetical protein